MLPLHVGTALRTAFLEPEFEESVADVHALLLFSEGILPVAALVKQEQAYRPVLVYAEHPAVAGLQWHLTLDLFKNYPAYREPVYYAPFKLPESHPMAKSLLPALPTLRFNPLFWEVLESHADGVPEFFAQWWPTEADPDFTASPTVQFMDRAYAVLRGIEAKFFVFLLLQWERAWRDDDPFDLGLEEQQILLIGPERKFLKVTYRPERGLGFHFPPEPEYVPYVTYFWKHLLAFAEDFKAHEATFFEQLGQSRSSYERERASFLLGQTSYFRPV
jgi:hypothetical protein